MKRRIDLMMDSGAYSAWNSGQKIDIKAYAAFLRWHRGFFSAAANLDVIPGRPGGAPNSREVELAAQESWKNLKTLRKEGLDVFPVFHYGERMYWLEKMVGEGEPLIGLGAIAKQMEAVRIRWLDEVFSFLCRNGLPAARTHGFGINAPSIMLRYPWYSVDSIGYILKGGMGKIFVPPIAAGKSDYRRAPMTIGVSVYDDKRNREATNDYRSLGPAFKGIVRDFIKGEGLTLPEVVADDNERIRINYRVIERISKLCRPRPFNYRPASLFGAGNHSTKPGEGWDHLRFYAGTTPGDPRDRMLTEEKVRCRLVSYWKTLEIKADDLTGWVRTGILPLKRDLPKENINGEAHH